MTALSTLRWPSSASSWAQGVVLLVVALALVVHVTLGPLFGLRQVGGVGVGGVGRVGMG